MTRMTGSDFAVMCYLINIHTCIHSFPLAMSICGEVASDVHTLIKELAIGRVDHRS